MKTINYRFNSLEDFLISSTSTVDGQLDDGWGALFRVKGREIAATVLFSDIAGFSRRTLDLNPTETLIFVNNFFSWISAEALRESKGIVDDRMFSSTITFPACEWGARDFTEMLPPEKYKHPDGSVRTQPHSWELREPRVVNLKNLPDHEVRELVKRSVHLPQQSAEERAREALESLRQAGRYWPDRDA